jgi:serine/threonine-protein phosphatase 4 regulatory subunit 1
MVSTEPKNEKNLKGWEEIGSINSTTDNSIQEPPNEQAELSEVETGNKGQPDFDEMISFNHTYLNYRLARCLPTREQLNEATFGLLMTNVFIYSGDIIDIKSLNNLPSSESVKNVRKKINDYKNTDIDEKITSIENIPYYVKIIGFQETAESILPILSELPKEKEILIERFFGVFPKFVDEIVKFGEKAYFILKDHMINLIRETLSNTKNSNILKSASDGLVYMTNFMKNDDKGGYVLTIVIQMAQEDEDEQRKETAMQLFGFLAPLVGSELIQCYIIPQVNSFVNDSSYKVRKEVATQLINISENIPPDLFKKKLLPVYQKLSNDESYLVKKVAAENLPKITKLCDTETISKELLPIFKNFVQDEKGAVRNVAIEIFGEFISLLNQNETENFSELLDFYVNTITELGSQKKESKTIIQKCAYNFPAVLQFFGAQAWPKLKPCFVKMANEKDEKIKMPLAASMGEISKLLGSELTESDLLEYVDKFFKSSSQNSELKIKILSVLPEIIKNIPSNRKNSYLEFIKYMIGNKDDKWRKRVTFCKIIGKFNGTYNDPIIYKRVFPIAINFCFDDISHVRSISARKNSRLILQLISSKTDFKDKTMKIITSFAQSINFRYRQLFIYMCKHFFENEEVFNANIADLLLDLAYDNIVNVRIILATFLCELIKKPKYSHLIKNETVRKILKILKNDKNKEIQDIIKDVKDVEDIEVELNKEVNNKFRDNMKFVSSEFGITRNVPLNSKFVEKKTPTPQESSNNSETKEENKEKTKEETPEKTEETPEKKE